MWNAQTNGSFVARKIGQGVGNLSSAKRMGLAIGMIVSGSAQAVELTITVENLAPEGLRDTNVRAGQSLRLRSS